MKSSFKIIVDIICSLVGILKYINSSSK